MTHVIFLAHGMGVYGAVGDDGYKPDDEWFEEAEAALKEHYDKFIKPVTNLSGGSDFSAHFTIERIRFDDWFEKYRQEWANQAETWSVFNFSNKFVAALVKAFQTNKADAFFWTHVLDVLLYKLILIKEPVQQEAAKWLYEYLKKHYETGQLESWSVIAHSLGTAVMHETLNRVLQLADDEGELDQAWLRPHAFVAVANVIRALNDDRIAYADALRPSSTYGPSWYVSCGHKLDPFCRPLPFKPPAEQGWTEESGFYDLTELDHYYLAGDVLDWPSKKPDFKDFASLVPHGFRHYMMQPEVVATLWPILLGQPPFLYEDLKETVETEYADKLEPAVEQMLKEKLGSALPSPLPSTLSGYLPSVEKILAELLGD